MRSRAHSVFLVSFLIISSCSFIYCWESYEMDLFDLVEEVNQNFYEYMGVSPNCDSSEIKKAYRKLSLQWHPDKNSDPQAETKFRHIVGIYEVLKDDAKRARYDKVLEFGLPDWKTPAFYFRRVRKLSFHELAIALSVIITIGHYFVMWAQYFERKLTIGDRMEDVKKKLDKQKLKKKKNTSEWDEIDARLQEMYDKLPSPMLKQTLPCKFSIWLFKRVCKIPSDVANLLSKKQPPVVEIDEEEERIKGLQEEANRRRIQKANENSRLQKELNPTKVEFSNLKPVLTYQMKKPDTADQQAENGATATNSLESSGQEWTNKQKADLIKAIARFPAGYVNRWNKIGDFVGRSANDCIQMEKQIRSNITSTSNSSLNSTSWSANSNKKLVNISEEPTISYEKEAVDAAADPTTEESAAGVDGWSQEQQKCLEKALKEVSKDASNRWDLIAEKVPNKTKNDCLKRYKEIVALLKNKA